MNIEFSYPADVIVLIKYRNAFTWYMCEKELWVLDLTKLRRDFETKLRMLNKVGNLDYVDPEREGLLVVDTNNIGEFQARIEKYKVPFQKIKQYFLLYPEKHFYQNSDEILPDFYIDFDEKIFFSFFSEPGSFEQYIPDGWNGVLGRKIDKNILEIAKKW